MEFLIIWDGLHAGVKCFLRARVFCSDYDGFVVVVSFVVSDVGTVVFSVVDLLGCGHVMYLDDSWMTMITIYSTQGVSKSISRKPWWGYDALTSYYP